uniref:Kinocilin n=1 Tax=Seriola lalandi dorsalis TaxID=1841481 RepID=A0A3B4YMS2_SERLL
MNPISVGEYHGLCVGSALLSIVAGCIIIGVSRECDADAVGGIFLGAGGLGLLISIYPFIKAWLNINHILPSFGNVKYKILFQFAPSCCFCVNPGGTKEDQFSSLNPLLNCTPPIHPTHCSSPLLPPNF